MRFEWKIAYRFLKENKVQTLFILFGIAIGVSVQIFLSSLIVSLQNNLVESTIGSSSHITFSSETQSFDESEYGYNGIIVENSPSDRNQKLNGWRELAELLKDSEKLTAVSPVVEANGFLVKGNAVEPILIKGLQLNEADKIYGFSDKLSEGSYTLQGNEALIGVELQREYNLETGDFIRIALPDGNAETLIVKGVFDLENQAINKSWVVLKLEKSQKLITKTDSITKIETQLTDVFAADDVGEYFDRRLERIAVDNWKNANASLLSALNSQSSSSITIQVFVLLAILLGISSVLGISVVQKSREIGILKAMGARNTSASRIFLMQGAALGFTGSILGCASGVALTSTFNKFAGAGFDIAIRAENLAAIVIITTAASFISAYIPSRNSKKLDPIEVIRNG